MTDKADPFEPTRLAVASDGERTRVPFNQAPIGEAPESGASAAPGPAPVWTGPGSSGSSGVPSPSGPAGGENLLQPGTLLNNTQRIEALIGRGGMGEVYRAVNVHTGDRDAIKVIRSDLATDPQVRELFRREAAALRKVRHPAVVSYEGVFGDDSGRVFLVMDFVDGPSLASMIARGPLEQGDVRRVGVQIAEGLAACHERGVVHRDLSPDNVVLRGGSIDHAVLIDFGVAKRLDGGSTLIGSGFAGKLDYCSPEQCGLFDGGIDHRTDVYSLGLLLAAAAAGKPLPMGSSMARAVKARETQPDLSGVPEELRRDLARLLEPDPARRPQSMREVAALLSYNAPPPPPPKPVSTVSPLWLVAWVGGGVTVVLLLVGLGVVIGPRVMAVFNDGTTTAEDTTADQAGELDEQRRIEEAARRKAEEEQREAEDRRRAEEDAKRQADERADAERRLGEEAQRKAEADKRAAEEARRKTEAERLAIEEAQRKAEADRRRLEVEAQRKAEADRRAAEDAQRKADADRRATEEARRRADEEARRQEAEHAAAERRRAEEEARRHAAAEDARRRAEEAQHRAEEERRAAAEAQRRADEERRRREAAQQPPPPPPQPQPAKPPAPVAVGTDGAWRGTICFRRLALTAGNETCGPLNLSIVGGTATGSWVVNGLTYGIHGAVGRDGGKVTLEMPPTGQGSSLGAKFTLAIRLNGAALQGEGYTINSVLVMFSAGR